MSYYLVFLKSEREEPVIVETGEIQELLERGPMFDNAIGRHGFTSYLRDYDVVVFFGQGQEYLYRFSHCPFVEVITRVGDNVWQRSWDDNFISYSTWLKSGEPDGYVWGICESSAYPGAKYIRDSSFAQGWASRLGKPMHEVAIETNAHNIRLVFHDLSVKELKKTDLEWVKQTLQT